MKTELNIPCGNECELRVLPMLQDGTAIPASLLSNIEVTIGIGCNTTTYEHSVDPDYVCVSLPADQKPGDYDYHLTATLAGRQVAMHRKGLFSRSLWDNGASVEVYNTKWVVVGSTNEETDRLKQELQRAIEAAKEAEREAKEAVKEAERTAAEALSTAISMKTGVATIKDDVQNDTFGLRAIWDKVRSVASRLNGYIEAWSAWKETAPTKSDIPQDYARQGIVAKTLDDIKVDIPSDYAKQGSNPEATNTAILEAVKLSADEVATLTALDSDIKAGKEALAREITGKGQPTSKDDTLMQMASAVQRIQHKNVELDASGMYSRQLFGGDPAYSPLWNLYDVLAQMKNKYLGLYNGLIVCEYYNGYDSLQLQGADAYYTCDGDEYDYDALHVWHDSDNGRANRWVCFLFRSEQSEFNIVNTDISPRSMYVGGHIHLIKYFVAGRLTEFVCGIEETDVVDYFDCTYANSWTRNVVMKGVKECGSNTLFGNSSTITTLICDVETCKSLNNAQSIEGPLSSLTYAYFPKLTTLRGGTISTEPHIFRHSTNILEVKMPNLKNTVAASDWRNAVFFGHKGNPSCLKVYDFEVGAMETDLYTVWHPSSYYNNPVMMALINKNIRDHIAAKVSDRTGLSKLTFTISTDLYNNLEQATLDAFMAKNWRVAGA